MLLSLLPPIYRALVVTLITGASLFYAQPTGRPWYERLIPAAAVSLGIGGAATVGSDPKPPTPPTQ